MAQSGVTWAARAGGDGRRMALPGKFPFASVPFCCRRVGGGAAPLCGVKKQHQGQER